MVTRQDKGDWEQVSKVGSGRRTRITYAANGLRVSGWQQRRRTKSEEERLALSGLADARSKVIGKQLVWVHDAKNYEDGWLSESDDSGRLGVQIRHMDSALIRSMNAPTKRAPPRVVSAAIVEAITDKANAVPESVRGATILALYVPIPLGVSVRHHICGFRWKAQGFLEVWICPDGESAFQIA
jgi:hypothetical protein